MARQIILILSIVSWITAASSVPKKLSCSALSAKATRNNESNDPNAFSIARVHVRRGKTTEIYAQTNRGIDHPQHAPPRYPSEWSQWARLKGKKILDLSCGGGQLVKDLRHLGVDAIGLDISLPKELKEGAHIAMFYEADAASMPFLDESFDVIYSNFGVFSYEQENPKLLEVIMKESARVLKINGKLRIHPDVPIEVIQSTVEKIPNLKMNGLEVVRIH